MQVATASDRIGAYVSRSLSSIKRSIDMPCSSSSGVILRSASFVKYLKLLSEENNCNAFPILEEIDPSVSSATQSPPYDDSNLVTTLFSSASAITSEISVFKFLDKAKSTNCGIV